MAQHQAQVKRRDGEGGVTDLAINRATEADASDLGIIGPAAYAAAYHDDWDDAVGFFHQLKTFGADAMLATLARPEARV